ncbi:hypothetical protein SLEP1_g47365 [Rubroshorea leprosula]|uniref:Uncharacterized protein n=1 Tax=Rubroshorea leprosula TaxID=152421 RepID=A0AAV5LS32_9ROSI|nr:hypothetical protein SLEP1_g47365 [Rubroshorea leprosula]
MASRRAGSKRKQMGSLSAEGQAQEEGNTYASSLFWDQETFDKYNAVKNLLVPPCNSVKFSQFLQGDMHVEEFSPREICAALEIPERGDDEFEDVNTSVVRATIAPNCTASQINVGFLTPENRALQWIISHIFAQRKGSKFVVLGSDLSWFDYILKRKRLNLERFIYRNLIKNYSSNMGLPHGALITRLAKRNNIDLTPYRLGKIQGGTTLNTASFENMQYELLNGIWRKIGDQAMEQQGDEEEGDVDQEMAEQREGQHGGDSLRPFQASMQKTNRETMELMINEMRQLHTDFYGFQKEMRGRMDSMDGKLDQLINHFFPPPPPSAT